MKTYFCAIERKQVTLPTNLNNDNRGRYGKWRYKGPDGLKQLGYYVKSVNGEPFESFKEISSDMAIELAHELNRKHYGIDKDAGRHYRVIAGRMPYYVEQYIKEVEATDPDNEWINTKHWQNLKNLLLQFGRRFEDYPMNKITLTLLEDWWFTRGDFADQPRITANSQRKRKKCMAELLAWLMRKELVPAMLGNPFKKHSDYEFKYLKQTKKKRQRLTLDDFFKIQKAAEKDGELMLSTAMALGLHTKLRREDLCLLTFENCLNDDRTIFKSKVTKWENQHQEEVWNEWVLDEHPHLQAALRTAIETSIACIDWKTRTRTPYILHRNFRTFHLPQDAKTKTHPSQVTGDYLGKIFAKYRDCVPKIRNMRPEEKPTFHEIRALAANLEIKSGFSLEQVSESMNHSDTETTEIYTEGHEVKVVQVASKIDFERLSIKG